MKLRTIAGALLLLLAATTPAAGATGAAQESNCAFPVERTDATGTNVTVESEPSRIVTLNPSAAQTLWEMGAQDKVVGVTRHAMNLKGAESKTNVSGAGKTVNTEEVVGLEPDLVLVPNATQSPQTLVPKLREAGLTVYYFNESNDIQDIYRKTRTIGRLTGECRAANDTVEWMQSELAAVDEAVSNSEKPTAIYTFFGYTAGEGTFIDTIIERAGAKNLAAQRGIQGYRKVNQEVLIDGNPDWIIRNTDQPNVPKTAAYNATTAVKQNQTVVVNTNYLNRPGPRVVWAVTNITEAMYSEAYAANETASATDATATDGSGPGFGAVGAVVALACVALLGRRRV